MRPLELTVEGFTAYREPTTIDFSDTDYFALVGPTGSGKSSVIDAICFALYGSVPRYDDQRLIAPAITQGAVEAKVSLRFSLGGEEYIATRVIRRTGGTKEARLEQGSDVLAGTVRELEAAVSRLLGLTFEQFTRCVVLPQGEFARFLHDDPGTRQDLLVRLLGLEVYEAMMQAANQRAKVASALAEANRRDLEERLSGVDEAQRREAKAELDALVALRQQVKQAQPKLEALAETIENADSTAAVADDWIGVLEGVSMPEGVGELSRALGDASKACAATKKAERSAMEAVKKAVARRKELGDEKRLLLFAERYDDLARVDRELVKSSEDLERLTKAVTTASKYVETAEADEASCQSAIDALKSEHAAHEVGLTLRKGEPCPACGQVVAQLRKRSRPPSLAAAEKALKSASRVVKKAREADHAARDEHASAKERVKSNKAEVARLKRQLAGAPSLEKVRATLQAIEEAEDALEAARSAQEDEVQKVELAEHGLREAQNAVQAARDDLQEARDELAALKPPKPVADPFAAWTALAEWASTTAARITKERDATLAKAAKASEQRAALVAELEEAAGALGLQLGPGNEAGDVVVEAATNAQYRLDRVKEILNDAKKARRELKAREKETAIASRLGYHLAGNQGRFPSWLLREALDLLAASASEILGSLSSGRYALAVDDKDSFIVVDHHNADEARPAKTLSGGETFLASLALALALSEHVVALATEGACLEALFLDEGFGTLDSESLDTVASTIETLGSSGRMVGLVTHVRELAERVPVRFEVRRDGRTARIEKVYA